MVNYTCCRRGVLEIKCPYCHRENALRTAAAQGDLQTCLLPKIMGNWYTRPSGITSNSSHDEQCGSSGNTEDHVSEDLSGNSSGCDQPRNCYCGGPEAGTMIGCDNPDCSIEWFHMECLELRSIPRGKSKWYCPNCRKLTKFLQRKYNFYINFCTIFNLSMIFVN